MIENLIIFTKRLTFGTLSLFFLYIASGYTLEFSDVHFKDGQRIGIYTGSFDPIHKGHQEVINYAIQHEKMDFVIIIPDQDSSDNKNIYKPNRTSFEKRYKMLEILFLNSKDNDKDNFIDNILITKKNKKGIISFFRGRYPHSQLVGIMGSDNYIRHIQKNTAPSLGVDEWLIIPRDEDRNHELIKSATQNAPNTSGLKIGGISCKIVAPNALQHQGHSSSYIREAFKNEGALETKERKEIKLNISSLLDNRILDFIKLEHLYENPSNMPLGGRSGENLYFIKDKKNDLIMVVKEFVTEKRNERFQRESRSIDIINSLTLNEFKTIHKTFEYSTESFHLLGLSPAPGASLEELMYRKVDPQKLKEIIFSIGSALAELHNIDTKEIKENQSINIDRYLLKIKDFQSKDFRSKDSRSKNLIEKIQSLEVKFRKNPGIYSYIHGDAQPGNYIVDIKNNNTHTHNLHTVYVIDLCNFGKYIDENNEPCGFAAHEYYQFLSSLDLHGRKFNMDLSDIEEFKIAFKNGYQYYLSTNGKKGPTNESMEFFKNYWEFRQWEQP